MVTARQIIDSNFPELSDKNAEVYAEILTPGLVLSSAIKSGLIEGKQTNLRMILRKGFLSLLKPIIHCRDI